MPLLVQLAQNLHREIVHRKILDLPSVEWLATGWTLRILNRAELFHRNRAYIVPTRQHMRLMRLLLKQREADLAMAHLEDAFHFLCCGNKI